ncbi:MAG: carbamoyltransferase [Alphaproteobacteria bacterium]|nr:carbamoyltransferase [Alphaproteobacteria bacterium]
MTYILGISAFYHDSAACLLKDGEIIAAAQEERFTRKKHDSGFPSHAIRYCLDEANVKMEDIAYVCFYDKPLLKFKRLIQTYLDFAPDGFRSFRKAIPLWVREKLFQKQNVIRALKEIGGQGPVPEILFSEHHLSHAASAFYPSPFEEAVVLTLDGVGEWATTSVMLGKGSKLTPEKDIHFPHSLGLLYSAFTYYLGFKVNSGEYKVMGLAPYGRPQYKDLILDHLVDVKEDGSFRMDMSYFGYCTGLKMTNAKFDELFGAPARKSETQITQREMDIAASLQAALEEILLKMTKNLYQTYKIPNLCLAGGVALNCVANGKILKESGFKDIWIQPAAGDAGGALGAAQAGYHLHLGHPRTVHTSDSMKGAYLGPVFSDEQIIERLKAQGAVFEAMSQSEMLDQTAKALADEKVIGWFNGRMEFGPRALGGRSIIGDARSSKMQSMLNLKIKYRESFRPFAPSVLREDMPDWFDLDHDSPYMLLVEQVSAAHKKPMSEEESGRFGIDKLNVARSDIPAVTHVDYSARIQSVHKNTNPLYHALISRFKELTGCPVIINTSFNIRGEPIVCTPEDAFRCFMGTQMDMLVLGNVILYKEKQDRNLVQDYRADFDLD